MNQADLDELVALIRSGENHDRAHVLAQTFADWKANLAKKAAQDLGPAFAACKDVQAVQSLASQASVGASPKAKERVRQFAQKRLGELLIGAA